MIIFVVSCGQNMGYLNVLDRGLLIVEENTCDTTNTEMHTLWLFNIAMENGPFIDDVPIKTTIYRGFSMAMLVITRWY